MGIRFLCPNGHKLHVKSFQAGRRGICPHCGARITIPSQSTLPESDATTSPNTKEVEDEEIAEEQVARESGEQVDRQAVPPMSPPKAGDPLGEAPGAKWFVSPPGGGQFGPANADMMRTWIAEGRVTADSLVWREGWDDWAEASTVLPHLVPPETASYLPSPEPTDALPAPNITISEPVGRTARAAAHPRRRGGRQRSPRNKMVQWVGILAAMVVVLVILFIWVVNRS
jgi:hypothetical protein